MTPCSPVFRAVANCVVPEASRLDAAQWDEMAAIVGRAIAARPRAMQRQLTLFLILLEWLPLLRYARPLSRLDPARRTKFLEQLQHNPLLLLRRGFLGGRALGFVGYYGRPPAPAGIGYRAAARGWEAGRWAP